MHTHPYFGLCKTYLSISVTQVQRQTFHELVVKANSATELAQITL